MPVPEGQEFCFYSPAPPMHILEACALQMYNKSNWNNYIIHWGVILVFIYLIDVYGKG